MIVKLATLVMWGGGLLFLASLTMQVDRFDYDKRLELTQCRQERAVDSNSISERCSPILQRENHGTITMFGGIALLLGGAFVRKKIVQRDDTRHD